MTMIYNGTEVVTKKDIKAALGLNDDNEFYGFCLKHHWTPEHTLLSGEKLDEFKRTYPTVTKSYRIGLYPKSEYDKAVSLAGIIADPSQVRGEAMAKHLANLSFESEAFGNLRAVTDNDGNPWFVAQDVASALEYKYPANAIQDHVFDNDKTIVSRLGESSNDAVKFKVGDLSTLEISNRGLMLINESGMYALIFRSKLPSAHKFEHWVTSEVLPSIRKTGGYRDVDRMQSQLDSMKEAVDRIERTTKNLWMALVASSAATKAIIEQY